MKFRTTCALLGLFFCTLESVYAQSSECDYSNAESYSGWGWNAVTQQSCEPVVCETTQRDPDEDGVASQDGQLCTVTEATASAPSFTNRQTGEPVVFEPVYWDANKDIANRKIQCDSFYFDETVGQYVVDDQTYRDNGLFYTSFDLYHHPVASVEPYEGWVETLTTYPPPVWSVENGVYQGSAPFTTPYLEIVSPPGTGKRVRRWVSAGQNIGPNSRWYEAKVRYDGYVECRDTSGDDFAPTGQLVSDTSVTYPLSDLQFSPDIGNSEKPTITSVTTGSEVELVNPVWNFNTDIANKNIFCGDYRSSGAPFNVLEGTSWQLPYVFDNSPETQAYHFVLHPDGIQSLGTWSVVDGTPTIEGSGRLKSILSAQYLEIAGNSVRRWALDGASYESCFGIVPSGSLPAIENNTCDYSAADLYNGWGWNSTTMESCAPVIEHENSDACDYTNAVLHDGWGWNPDTMQSCPPQTTPVNQPVCEDTDGDGYGWDGVATCDPS